ncbi:hypothetical protein OIO90_001558 [Microbotryomycetes sp. JL221]|nr:hypothetical protein OIO90_001558 [Microbotryomycetes sp. JL221]
MAENAVQGTVATEAQEMIDYDNFAEFEAEMWKLLPFNNETLDAPFVNYIATLVGIPPKSFKSMGPHQVNAYWMLYGKSQKAYALDFIKTFVVGHFYYNMEQRPLGIPLGMKLSLPYLDIARFANDIHAPLLDLAQLPIDNAGVRDVSGALRDMSICGHYTGLVDHEIVERKDEIWNALHDVVCPGHDADAKDKARMNLHNLHLHLDEEIKGKRDWIAATEYRWGEYGQMMKLSNRIIDKWGLPEPLKNKAQEFLNDFALSEEEVATLPLADVFCNMVMYRIKERYLYSILTLAKQPPPLANLTHPPGGFSGAGLQLFYQLAQNGAQVIALHPDPTDARILQLVELIRFTTGSERTYVEQCDLLDFASIRIFAERWKKDGRSGMVQDLEARIDAIVFCDGEGSGLEGLCKSGDVSVRETLHQAYCTSRHALVQSLLPTLLKSGQVSSTPIRIVNQVSPTYSTAVRLEPTPIRLKAAKYWSVEGHASMLSLALAKESQMRLEKAGLAYVNVCGGFSRDWAYSTVKHSIPLAWFEVMLTWMIWPLVWLFCKTSESTCQVMLMALCAPLKQSRVPNVEDLVERNGRFESETTDEGEDLNEPKLVGGALYRDGQRIRVANLEQLPEDFGRRLWDAESELVKQGLCHENKKDA